MGLAVCGLVLDAMWFMGLVVHEASGVRGVRSAEAVEGLYVRGFVSEVLGCEVEWTMSVVVIRLYERAEFLVW